GVTRTFTNTADCLVTDIAHDSANAVYVTGTFSGTIDFKPGVTGGEQTGNGASSSFLTKLLSDGSYSWHQYLGGLANGPGVASGGGVAFDGTNVYVGATFSGQMWVGAAGLVSRAVSVLQAAFVAR